MTAPGTVQAREIFKVGQVVKLTAEGLQLVGSAGKTIKPRATTGVVVGFSQHPWVVRVQRDGDKSVTSWHARFWEAG